MKNQKVKKNIQFKGCTAEAGELNLQTSIFPDNIWKLGGIQSANIMRES